MLKVASGCTDSLHSSPWTPSSPVSRWALLERSAGTKSASLCKGFWWAALSLFPNGPSLPGDNHTFDRKRYPLQSPALQELMSFLKLLFLLIQTPVTGGEGAAELHYCKAPPGSNQPHWKPLWVSLWPCVVPSKQTHTAHLQRQFPSSARNVQAQIEPLGRFQLDGHA